ncbi:hypothetical protein C8N36_12126 [Pelagimonas varians]|uniref:Uncharacterized protein n=1 Tax=Pelagimonas varians TaxID=696760 RepID=A0A238L4N9_9RHOB|nr:hypothetical protein C8N36_12126 [Pelagimonas varians]SMX49362.1 hypothetical protein PEV8663_04187 [Pelagimonas varians]
MRIHVDRSEGNSVWVFRYVFGEKSGRLQAWGKLRTLPNVQPWLFRVGMGKLSRQPTTTLKQVLHHLFKQAREIHRHLNLLNKYELYSQVLTKLPHIYP